jgi:hypothetical protein
MEYKNQKIKNERQTFWDIMLFLTLEKQDKVKKILSKNCARYCLDPAPEPETEQEPEPNFSEVGTRTAIYH